MCDRVIVSDEKQFMFRDAFNRGYVQTPNMVENCIGLSNDAKTVYSNILNHIYEKGDYAFPSIYRLAISCSCSTNSVSNYVNELVEKGFISKESRGRGRSNHYRVKDVNKVTLLQVSEMFWKCMSQLVNLYGWKNILPAKDKILKYMKNIGYELKDMETDNTAATELTELLKHVLVGGTIKVGLLPRNTKFEKPVEHVPKVVEQQQSIMQSIKHNIKIVGNVKNDHWSLLHVDEWKIEQFRDYYYDKYLDAIGQPHPLNMKKHTGIMHRIVKTMEGKNELLKSYIDTVFEIGYDNMTLDYLSAHRLEEIQTFLVSGKKPFYMEKKYPKVRDVESVLIQTGEIMSSSEMLKRMLGSDN
ncbi:helix-turn-helix domain-containing protein [Metabacillus fastidiosus]|uniref:helix-turn-helix domain-containing protein n=1 Tax=Metabacillus fastidiosus TaxID=1458 RepID=UPI003D2AA14B